MVVLESGFMSCKDIFYTVASTIEFGWIETVFATLGPGTVHYFLSHRAESLIRGLDVWEVASFRVPP